MGKESLDPQSMLFFIILGSIILLSLSSVVSYEFGLFLKDLRTARFNLIYLLLALIPLVILIYYGNYKFHNKIFRRKEEEKQKEAELTKQEEHLKELLDNEFHGNSDELRKKIEEVESLRFEIDNNLFDSYEAKIESWLKQVKEEFIN